jgi:uncharacterized repeat protein (TIGR02543 family)
MQTLTTLKRTDFETANQTNPIDLLIDKKEYDILTEDCLCIIDEVDFVKIIDTTTQTPLPVVETTQPTATLLPRKGVSKFFSRLGNRLTVLPLTMPLCLVMMLGLFVGNGWGQTTLFSDNFGTSTGASYDNSGAIGTSSDWSLTLSGADWGAKIDGGILNLTNDVGATANVNGWVFGYRDINALSGWNTTLSSNTGTITWEFNMRQIRTDPAGFGVGSYGAAFVLAGTSATAATAGSGYAIVLGQSGATDAIRLASYNNGLQGTLTNIITSNTAGLTDFGAQYLSIRVTYIPSSNTWELFLRNDGTTAFTDPTSGSALTSQGTAVNNTYTSTVGMRYIGGYWQGATAGTQTAFFDNVYLKKTVPSFTVTFNDNGSTGGSMSDQTSSSATNLTANAFTRTGYTFAGWNTAADGSGTSYADEASYPFDANVTLYAQWTANTLNVTYDSQGGSAISSGTTTTGGSIASSPGSPTRSGYTFNGWFVASSGGSAISFPYSHGQTADFTLYAQWTAAGTPTLNAVTLASALSTTYGTASAGVSFAVSGSNLTTTITVTPQSGYEIATSSGGTYQSTAMTGIANGTTLWVRFASTISAGDKSNAIAVVLSGGGASSNADVTTSSSGNTVNQKALTVTGLTAQNKVYDGLTTASTTGTAALSGVVGADDVSLTGTPTYTFASANVGTGISVSTNGYSLTGAQSGNYTLTQPSFTADITVRSLTITADDVSKYAGVALTGGAGSTAFTSSGLQNGETIGSVTITYGSAGSATGDGNTIGVYASQVTPSAATSGTFTASNYSINYVAGSISVTPAPEVIAIQDFETSPATPTWNFSGNGATSTTASKFNGAQSYSMTASQTLTLNNINISGYSDVILSVAFAANGPDSGEDLFMDISYDNGGTWIGNGSIKLVDGFSNTPLNINTTNVADPTTVASNPWPTNISSTETQISVRFRVVGLDAGEYYWIDDVKVTGVPIPTAPVLSTPTATSIATTSSTLGATVTSDGGASITARGTVYGTSASPTTNSLAEGGTTVSAFTHSRTGLTANTFYYYRGYATNSVGTGYSADGTFTTLHNAPTVGSGSNATATTIDASWTAPSGGSEAFTYEIQVDNDSDFSSPTFTLSNISSGTTTLTATGLASNTTYYFRVRANNAAGSSAWSSTSTGYATTVAASPTLSGTSLTAFGNVCINTTTSPNSFIINGASLTSADVTVSSLSGFTFSTTSGGTYTSTLTLSQVGGTYAQDIYVKFNPTAVQSYDGNIVIGGGGASNINVAASGSGIAGSVSVTTTAASSITSTGASTGGSAVSTSCGAITAKGAAYGTSANPTTPVTSDGSGTGDFTSTLTGLTPNTLYNYRAYATNSNSVTSYGSNLTFTTLHNAPTVGTGSNPETTGFTANWSAPTGGGSETFTYEVAVSTSSTFATTLTSQTGIASGTTSYQLTGLSNGTTYYFRVRVNNAGGSSDWSAISLGITTLTPWENFESGTKSGYTAADVIFPTGIWNLNEALSVTSDANDREFGTKSIRIRNTGIAEMKFDVTNGISNLTIYHALYGSDASSTWRLEVSNNSGISWDAYVSSDITTSSTTLTAETFNVDLCGALRFRIVKRNVTSRINFDDIVLIEKAATPSAPAASAQSFCSASSPTVASLNVTTGSNIQWYDASTNGNLLSSGTSLATGTYYASQTVSGCESATRASVSVTINSSGTWIGDSNDDWNVAGNWCGGIPNSNTAIVNIPENVTITLDASPSVLNLTVGSGSVVNAGDNTLSIANGGTFTNNGSFNSETSEVVFLGTGSIGGTNPVTFNNLTLNGNVTINTTPTVSAILQLNSGANVLNKVIYYGASGQLYYNQSGTINATSFEWPTTNKPSQVAVYNNTEVLLNENKSISGSLNLANGKVNLGSYHLTLETSATISTGGFSSARMVIAEGNGELRKRFTEGSSNPAEFIFPVGTKTGAVEYTPVHLDFSSALFGSNAYVGVKVRNTKNVSLNSGVTNYLDRNWIVEPSDITNYTYKIQLYYNQNDFVTDGSLAEGNLIPIKISSGQWYQPTDGTFNDASSQGTGTVFPSNDYLEWNNLTTFSEFGGAGGSNQPLPVELFSFSSECIENQTVLTWQTASEHNASHFDIEKSTDGTNWRVIGQVQAAGNSTELLSYNFVDNDKSNAYYRLNQLDIDGKNEYFGPVSSTCEPDEFKFLTSPNPSNSQFNLQIYSNVNESVNIEIQDLNGKIVQVKQLNVQNGINIYPIHSDFPQGVYYIRLVRENNEIFIIKQLIF